MQVKNDTYLIPKNAILNSNTHKMSPDDLKGQYIQLSQLIYIMDKTSAEVIIVLDSCRNNPFSAVQGLAEATKLQRILIAYAAQPGATASNVRSEKGTSPYTDALIEEISKKGQRAETIFKNVAAKVHKSTHGVQEPYTSHYGSLFNFEFNPYPSQPSGQPPP
jgi:uncharacterized caspase-like protein